MWGAYLNGFLCGVMGYVYLRCMYLVVFLPQD